MTPFTQEVGAHGCGFRNAVITCSRLLLVGIGCCHEEPAVHLLVMGSSQPGGPA